MKTLNKSLAVQLQEEIMERYGLEEGTVKIDLHIANVPEGMAETILKDYAKHSYSYYLNEAKTGGHTDAKPESGIYWVFAQEVGYQPPKDDEDENE